MTHLFHKTIHLSRDDAVKNLLKYYMLNLV
jgi:hypothetical protein